MYLFIGKLLQAQANNIDTCVIKLSQSQLHRANGSTFKLGDEIIKTLDLQQCFTSLAAQKRIQHLRIRNAKY